jgi:hypothetical protein
MKIAAVLLAALLTFGACSSEATSYPDAASLSRALVDGGVTCGSLRQGEDADLIGEHATCSDEDLDLYLFDSERDRDDWLKLGARIRATASGPNWVITGETETVERAADALDAEFDDPS